ncbi:hypothetical protein Tco_0708017 [Tanacetum coccineum]
MRTLESKKEMELLLTQSLNLPYRLLQFHVATYFDNELSGQPKASNVLLMHRFHSKSPSKLIAAVIMGINIYFLVDHLIDVLVHGNMTVVGKVLCRVLGFSVLELAYDPIFVSLLVNLRSGIRANGSSIDNIICHINQ